jgi:hypothetical protein
LLAIAGLVVGSMLLVVLHPAAVLHNQQERIGVLGWTIYDLAILGVALLVCFQLPYRRRDERIRLGQPGLLQLPAVGSVPVALRDLSLSGAKLRVAGDWPLTVGTYWRWKPRALGHCVPRSRGASRAGEVDSGRHRIFLATVG